MSLAPGNSDVIGGEEVVPLLRALAPPGATWIAGLPYQFLPRCPSTNAALKQVVESAAAGTTVITDEQTDGRGRLGRTWLSEPGRDLTFSVLLRPGLTSASGHLLSLATGVAVAEALEEGLGLEGQVTLKWPNDVLLSGKKVCGILLEASAGSDCIHWAVAGIGLNVNSEPSGLPQSLPPERAREWRGRPEPVSLKEHLGRSVARAPLLAALLARLTSQWTGLEQAGAPLALLDGWRCRDALAGRWVEVAAWGDPSDVVARGEAAGIGEVGQLLVRSEEGMLQEVFAGDVSVTVGPGALPGAVPGAISS